MAATLDEGKWKLQLRGMLQQAFTESWLDLYSTALIVQAIAEADDASDFRPITEVLPELSQRWYGELQMFHGTNIDAVKNTFDFFTTCVVNASEDAGIDTAVYTQVTGGLRTVLSNDYLKFVEKQRLLHVGGREGEVDSEIAALVEQHIGLGFPRGGGAIVVVLAVLSLIMYMHLSAMHNLAASCQMNDPNVSTLERFADEYGRGVVEGITGAIIELLGGEGAGTEAVIDQVQAEEDAFIDRRFLSNVCTPEQIEARDSMNRWMINIKYSVWGVVTVGVSALAIFSHVVRGCGTRTRERRRSRRGGSRARRSSPVRLIKEGDPISAACVTCDQSADLVCARCESPSYCSEACQRRDWNSGHYKACRVYEE